MKSSYKTSEEAQADLIANGFTRYISCIDGSELFSKENGSAYPSRCIARIQHNWVAPQWGDNLNYFNISFI
jgi:hypothetical protein